MRIEDAKECGPNADDQYCVNFWDMYARLQKLEQPGAAAVWHELQQYVSLADLRFIVESARPIEPLESEFEIRQRDICNEIDNILTKHGIPD